jgi:hypothetical protein
MDLLGNQGRLEGVEQRAQAPDAHAHLVQRSGIAADGARLVFRYLLLALPNELPKGIAGAGFRH